MIRAFKLRVSGQVRLCFLCACTILVETGCSGASPQGTDDIGSVEQSIYEGTLDTNYPSIGFLTDSHAGADCGATMLSNTLAITAKHCWNSTMQLESGNGPYEFVDHIVDAQLRHPTLDLMLLHLATPWFKYPIVISGNVSQDRQMSTSGPPSLGDTCTIVGFGKHDGAYEDGTYRYKRSAKVTVSGVYTTTVNHTVLTGNGAAGDSGGPLFCNNKFVGVFDAGDHNNPGNPSTSLLIDQDWVASNTGLVPPSVTNSLYITNGPELRRVDDAIGNFQAISSPSTSPAADWSNTTSMAELTVSGVPTLYAINAGYFTSIDPATGISQTHGSPIWTGRTFMTATSTALYVAQGDNIWQIDNLSTGSRHAISSAWTDAVAMTNLNGLLYLIKYGQLYSVSMVNGYASHVGAPNWAKVNSSDTTNMAVSGSKLYIQNVDTIYRVDNLTTGAFTTLPGAGGWAGITSMIAFGGRLFLVQSNYLIKYSLVNGYSTLLGQNLWGGAISSAAVP